jgi:hypothetical protein
MKSWKLLHGEMSHAIWYAQNKKLLKNMSASINEILAIVKC